MLAELAQTHDQLLADEIEALVDVLEPCRRHRLDADERALDTRLAHRLEERRVLGGFHRDLREEDHVVGQLRRALHELEPLGAKLLELVQPRRILAAARSGRDRLGATG